MEPEKEERAENVDIIKWLLSALMMGTAIYVAVLILQEAGFWGV
jgi:hypothetical protein